MKNYKYEYNKLRDKIIMAIVWKFPGRILLWAVIRGFADATTGDHGNKHPDDVGYKDVYDSIVKKYKLKK